MERNIEVLWFLLVLRGFSVDGFGFDEKFNK